jgi:hypothetical protein
MRTSTGFSFVISDWLLDLGILRVSIVSGGLRIECDTCRTYVWICSVVRKWPNDVPVVFGQVRSSFGARFTDSLLIWACRLVGDYSEFPKVSPTSHELVYLHMCRLERR